MNSQSKHAQVSRRGFLWTAGGGAAVVSVLPGTLLAEEAASTQPTTKPAKPATGVLGKTGYSATRVSFGAIKIAPPHGGKLLKQAIDDGMNLVHTALGYGRGKSCAAIGGLLKEHPEYREKMFLCFKYGGPDKGRQLGRGLKVLHTDHADMLVPTLHKPDPVRLADIVAFQDELVKAGKIRFKGFTCHGQMNEVLELVLKEAPDAFDGALLSLTMVMPTDKQKGSAERQRFAANLKALRGHKVGIISMKTGARDAVRQGKEVFEPHVKAAVKGGADTVLTSISTFGQLEMIKQLGLSSLAISWRQRWLTAALCGESCLMCGRCSRACPNDVPVNDLVRVASYPSSPGWSEHAADEFAALKVDAARIAATCGDCTACSKACPVGLASGRAVRTIVDRFSTVSA